MAFIPQGSVGQVTDAYRNNPGALQERYGVTKQLVDLMALQRINAEQQAIANQMEMDLGAQANKDGKISDQVALQAFDNTSNNIAQMAGLGGILNARSAQGGAPQAGGPPPQGGLNQLPAPNMQQMSGGGIVSFARGTEDVIDSERLKDLQTNSGPKDENIALLDEMLDAEGVTDLEERAFIRAIYEQESSSGTNPAIWDEEGDYAESANIGDMQMSEIARKELERVGRADEGELDINTREGNIRGGIRYALLGLEKAGGDVELGATYYYGGDGGLEAARSGEARFDADGPDMPSTLEYGSEVADITSEIFGSLGYSEPDVAGGAQTTAEARAAQDMRRATAPEVDVDELTALTMDSRAAAREAASGGEEEGRPFYNPKGVIPRIQAGWERNRQLSKDLRELRETNPDMTEQEIIMEYSKVDPNEGQTVQMFDDAYAGTNPGITTQGYDDATAGINPDMRAFYEAMGGDEASERLEAEGIGTGTSTPTPSTSGLNWEDLTDFLSGAQGTTTGSALGAGAQAMTTGRHAREVLDRDEALQYAKLDSEVRQIELRNRNELDKIRATATAKLNQSERDAIDDAWSDHVQSVDYITAMNNITSLEPAQQDIEMANYIMEWYDRQRTSRAAGMTDVSSLLGTGTTSVANTGT